MRRGFLNTSGATAKKKTRPSSQDGTDGVPPGVDQGTDVKGPRKSLFIPLFTKDDQRHVMRTVCKVFDDEGNMQPGEDAPGPDEWVYGGGDPPWIRCKISLPRLREDGKAHVTRAQMLDGGKYREIKGEELVALDKFLNNEAQNVFEPVVK
jgi:hypothetical protein